MANYWKGVAFDYKDSLMSVYKGSLAKPKKAAFISSILASCLYMNKTNPNMRDFEGDWIEYNIALIRVGEGVRNKVRYLESIMFRMNVAVETLLF